MVNGKSGNFTISGSQGMGCKVYWSESCDVENNLSVLTVDVKILCTGMGGGYRYYLNGSISVGGSAVVSFHSAAGSHSVYAVYGQEADIHAGSSSYAAPPWSSGNIAHDSDGSKSVSVSVNFSGYSPDGGGSSGFSISGSSTVALTTIPRASSVTSAANTTLGNKCGVKWTPLSSAFRYKLKFSLGDWSDTTGVIAPGTTAAYTYTGYTIPLAVANRIDASAKTGTMTATLYTYSDAGCTSQIGAVSSKSFTVTIPENASTKPSVSMTYVPVSSLSSTFADLFIQGMSKLQATITASGKYGASVAAKTLVFQGKGYEAPFLTDFISGSGQLTVKAIVTDSRGFTGEARAEIPVIPYQKPSLLPASGESGIVCARCDSSGKLTEAGAYLRMIAGRSYSKVMADGVQKNFCEIRFRYRQEADEGFSDWVTLLDKSDTSADTVDSGPVAAVVPSVQTSYVVQLGVVDELGQSDAIQYIIPTDFVTVDCPERYGGRRMGLFRYVDGTEEDGVYVGLPIFGGSVNSLLTGSKLTATADAPVSLSEFKTPGCYFCPDAANAQYITDCPYKDGGFRLEVRELFSKDTIRQQIDCGSAILLRYWDGETWSAWLRVLTESQDTQ